MKNTIIVIGAGCAGMIAALMAQAEGASVVLIDRNAIGLGTNSALSAGRFTAPNTHYHPDEYIQNTLDTGRGINSEMIVRIVAHPCLFSYSFFRA